MLRLHFCKTQRMKRSSFASNKRKLFSSLQSMQRAFETHYVFHPNRIKRNRIKIKFLFFFMRSILLLKCALVYCKIAFHLMNLSAQNDLIPAHWYKIKHNNKLSSYLKVHRNFLRLNAMNNFNFKCFFLPPFLLTKK